MLQRLANPAIAEVADTRTRSARSALQKHQEWLVFAARRNDLPGEHLDFATWVVVSGGIERNHHPVFVNLA